MVAPFTNTSKVLIVAGGVDAGQALASSELLEFDQTGATWYSATSLPGAT